MSVCGTGHGARRILVAGAETVLVQCLVGAGGDADAVCSRATCRVVAERLRPAPPKGRQSKNFSKIGRQDFALTSSAWPSMTWRWALGTTLPSLSAVARMNGIGPRLAPPSITKVGTLTLAAIATGTDRSSPTTALSVRRC
jgi:hypothetical protein